MGRPRKPIDPDLVEKLAAIACTDGEIAEFFGVNESTIKRRFAPLLKKGRAVGKISIKRKQFDAALAGSVPLLIWLGKQYLGQRDKVETENITHNDGPLVQVMPPTASSPATPPAS